MQGILIALLASDFASRVLKKLDLGGKTANKPELKRFRTRIKSRRIVLKNSLASPTWL